MVRNRRPTPAAGKQAKPQKGALLGPSYLCEAEVVEGLEAFAARELATMRAAGIIQVEGSVQFRYGGDLTALWRLRTVQAVYLLHRFPVPRPLALLGDQNWRALLQMIEVVRRLSPADAYRTFYLAAAGSESSVMTRIKQELARQTGLQEAEAMASAEQKHGDLLLRLRRPLDGGEGWEALVRLSPRPLATRSWRVCNLEGALNATIAAAMVLLTEPQADDIFLNVGCGSGTLLIERLAQGPARSVIGCDTSPEAVECARQNVQAAGLTEQIALHPWDARALPLPDASVTAQCADLPFGHLVGSHQENVALYPAMLAEAARVAQPGSRLACITQEVRLMQTVLAAQDAWEVQQFLRVQQRALTPGIFVLRRQ